MCLIILVKIRYFGEYNDCIYSTLALFLHTRFLSMTTETNKNGPKARNFNLHPTYRVQLFKIGTWVVLRIDQGAAIIVDRTNQHPEREHVAHIRTHFRCLNFRCDVIQIWLRHFGGLGTPSFT